MFLVNYLDSLDYSTTQISDKVPLVGSRIRIVLQISVLE